MSGPCSGRPGRFRRQLRRRSNQGLSEDDARRVVAPERQGARSIVDYTRAPSVTGSPALDPVFNCTAITLPARPWTAGRRPSVSTTTSSVSCVTRSGELHSGTGLFAVAELARHSAFRIILPAVRWPCSSRSQRTLQATSASMTRTGGESRRSSKGSSGRARAVLLGAPSPPTGAGRRRIYFVRLETRNFTRTAKFALQR